MKGLLLASLIVGPPPVPVTPPPPPPPPSLGVEVGEPSFGGSGCPGGKVSMILSPEDGSSSISFEAYAVTAGGSGGKALDRQTCNLAVPVHVPTGVQISLLGAHFDGSTDLPKGAKAIVHLETFFAGAKGPTSDKTIEGPASAPFAVPLLPDIENVQWSSCGADVILRINSSIRVTATGDAAATASITSASLNQLTARAC